MPTLEEGTNEPISTTEGTTRPSDDLNDSVGDSNPDVITLELAHRRAVIRTQTFARAVERKSKRARKAEEELKTVKASFEVIQREMIELEMQLIEAKGRIKKVGAMNSLARAKNKNEKVETVDDAIAVLKGMSKEAQQNLFKGLSK